MRLPITPSVAFSTFDTVNREREAVDAQELLVANLAVVDRVVAFTCRRYGLTHDEAEEFAAIVKLKLVEDDYAIMRKFEGRCALTTYLSIVIHRLLLDYRTQLWGKWHASAEAKRLGAAAVELEQLLYRDGEPLDRAAEVVAARHALPHGEVTAIASRLRDRAPKRRLVPIEEAESVASDNAAEMPSERHVVAEKVSAVVRRYVDSLPPDERLILQLRFDSDMSVAQIARSLKLDQKQLYRAIEKHLRRLRDHLEEAGIESGDAATVIGDRGVMLDFDLRNRGLRPSTTMDGVAATEEEVSR